MGKILKTFYKTSIITAILLLLLGILLIFESEGTIIAISYIIGASLVAVGLTAIINFFISKVKDSFVQLNIVYGIVTIISGILIITYPMVIASFIPIIVGITIIVNSAFKLQYSLELRNMKNNMWKWTLLISIISLLCGIVLIFNPFKGVSILAKIVGAFIVTYSVLDMISTYTIKKSILKKDLMIEDNVIDVEVKEK